MLNISHKWTVCENISQNNLYTYSEIVKHGGVLLVFEATTDKEAAGGEELACEREPHSANSLRTCSLRTVKLSLF